MRMIMMSERVNLTFQHLPCVMVNPVQLLSAHSYPKSNCLQVSLQSMAAFFEFGGRLLMFVNYELQ